MAPEKKYAPSSVFTVRLGFGSVILAAVITLVGLAWIFFLGVMVGRIYYGTDGATNSQSPSVVQENTDTQDDAHEFTSDSTHSKTGTTYPPVVKEDKRLEQISHKPHTFAEDLDAKNAPIKNADTIQQDVSASLPTSEDTASSITSHDAPHGTALLETTGSIATSKQDNLHSKLVIKANTDKQNTSNSAIISQASQITDTINDSKDTKEPIFLYTYQLATFKNTDNAGETVKKLCADGINASLLQEEKDGSIMYYILVHDTGTESSQKQLVEKFAQHHFTKFITRRSAIQE